MKYEGKTVVKTFGRAQNGQGAIRLYFSDGSRTSFEIYHEQWTEVDGGWIIKPLNNLAGTIHYIKDYRRWATS